MAGGRPRGHRRAVAGVAARVKHSREAPRVRDGPSPLRTVGLAHSALRPLAVPDSLVGRFLLRLLSAAGG